MTTSRAPGARCTLRLCLHPSPPCPSPWLQSKSGQVRSGPSTDSSPPLQVVFCQTEAAAARRGGGRQGRGGQSDLHQPQGLQDLSQHGGLLYCPVGRGSEEVRCDMDCCGVVMVGAGPGGSARLAMRKSGTRRQSRDVNAGQVSHSSVSHQQLYSIIE